MTDEHFDVITRAIDSNNDLRNEASANAYNWALELASSDEDKDALWKLWFAAKEAQNALDDEICALARRRGESIHAERKQNEE